MLDYFDRRDVHVSELSAMLRNLEESQMAAGITRRLRSGREEQMFVLEHCPVRVSSGSGEAAGDQARDVPFPP